MKIGDSLIYVGRAAGVGGGNHADDGSRNRDFDGQMKHQNHDGDDKDPAADSQKSAKKTGKTGRP